MIKRKLFFLKINLLSIILCSVVYAQSEKHQVYFSIGDYDLSADQKEYIDSQIEILKSFNEIVLIGSTDPLGEIEYNTWLGLKRAETVRDYLYLKHKIGFNKILTVSSGIDRTQQSSNFKRRVDIKSNEKNDSLIRSLSSEIQSEQNQTIINNESSSSNEDLTQIYKKIQELENRLDSHINDQKDSNVQANDENSKDKENVISENIEKEEQIVKAENTKSKPLTYELRLNTYFADQKAQFNSSSSINELLSEQRLSFEFDIYKEISEKWLLNLELGLRWNAYSADPELNTVEDWDGYGSRAHIGLLNKFSNIFSYSGFIGFEQLLSHTVDGVGVITPELEPVLRLGFQASVRLINEYNFDLNIGPRFSLISGLGDIEQGYSYGIHAKANMGEAKKYFLTFGYELNNFDQDVRIFDVETMELGLGINF